VITYRYPSAPLKEYSNVLRGVVVPLALRTLKVNEPCLFVDETAIGMLSVLGSTTDPLPELPPPMVAV